MEQQSAGQGSGLVVGEGELANSIIARKQYPGVWTGDSPPHCRRLKHEIIFDPHDIHCLRFHPKLRCRMLSNTGKGPNRRSHRKSPGSSNASPSFLLCAARRWAQICFGVRLIERSGRTVRCTNQEAANQGCSNLSLAHDPMR